MNIEKNQEVMVAEVIEFDAKRFVDAVKNAAHELRDIGCTRLEFQYANAGDKRTALIVGVREIAPIPKPIREIAATPTPEPKQPVKKQSKGKK